MHKGVCVGGPLAGETVTTRSDVGFVAVDRPGFAAWLYLIDDAGRYVVDTSDDPSRIDADGTRVLDVDRALEAATEQCLDVVALPGDGSDDDPEPGEVERIPEELLDEPDGEEDH